MQNRNRKAGGEAEAVEKHSSLVSSLRLAEPTYLFNPGPQLKEGPQWPSHINY